MSALILTACSEDEAMEFCVEEHVQIARGLYGRVTYQTDVSPQTNPLMPVAGELISVLDKPGGGAVAETISDGSGIYQVDLPIGTYSLCQESPSRCVTFDVTEVGLVRADLRKGFGNYWELLPPSDCAR